MENKDIIVEEYESHIVRKVFEMYAPGIYSMDMLRKRIKMTLAWYGLKAFWIKCSRVIFTMGLWNVKEKLYPHRYPPIITQSTF